MWWKKQVLSCRSIVQSCPIIPQMIWFIIFEATFNSTTHSWLHGIGVTCIARYKTCQMFTNTWFYVDVAVKHVVCVGCFFVSCVFLLSSCVLFFSLVLFPCVSCCSGFIVGSCHQMSPLTLLTRQASVEWYPSTGASFCSSSKVVGRRRGGKVVDGTTSRWVNSLWRIFGKCTGYI